MKKMIREEQPGFIRERAEYLYGPVVRRNAQRVHELRQIYSGQCQICTWNPLGQYGNHLCEAHHIHWLSRGGCDDMGHLVLLCPNYHRAVHHCDAPFDFADMCFDFGMRKERLRINHHLSVA